MRRFRDSYYFVTYDGRIYNNKLKRYVKPRSDKDGYMVLWMNIDGGRVTMKVHRVVAEAYIPNPRNLPQVNHKDCDKGFNRVPNLEWCEQDYNIRHSFDNGRHRTRMVGQYNVDGRLMRVFRSVRDAARCMNRHHTAIDRCCSGRMKSLGGYHWKYEDSSK